MLHRTTFNEQDRERITERLRELARFSSGDHVTVEPSDTGIAYAGKELEGMLLTIEDVSWNGNNLSTPPNSHRLGQEREDFEDRHVLLMGEYEYYQPPSVYLSTIEYTFEETDRFMSETSLMPWEEYKRDHEKVVLSRERKQHGKSETWLEPTEDPCDLCGCNRIRVSNRTHPVVDSAGQRECAGCGDVLDSWHP